MAFSLFGKKPSKNETPLVKKVEERQRAVRPQVTDQAPPPPPSQAPDSAADLDFTNFVPSSAQASPPSVAPKLGPGSIAPAAAPSIAPSGAPSISPPAAAPSVAPPATGSGFTLDFSAMPGVGEAPAGPPPAAPLPSLPPAVAASAPAPAPKESARKKAKAVDSILCIEVEESGGHDIPAPIEEGAVLFANGQAEEALVRMKAALAKGGLGAWQLQVWLMIFDLLQHLNKRAEFEEFALEFVVKFERSPPVWVEAPPKAPAAAAARGAAANVVLTGTLGAQSANAFEQLKKAAEKQPRLKLDFSKLQGVEPEGAKLLLATLKHLRAAKKDAFFAGEGQLTKLLREQAKAGDASVDQSVWLALLEVYQQLGQMNEFEEAAVDFAVTYEVSPPSYDPAAVKAKPSMGTSQAIPVEPTAATDGEEEDADVFRISGEVAGANDQLFTDLAAYGAGANPVVVDMKRTRRIDFVNAGRLLNVLEKLKAEGKAVVVRGPGEMIIALFAVMGIPKVARVIPRK